MDSEDVLLPVHEQAFLFARVREDLRKAVGLAVPDFDTLARVQNKVTFLQVLDQLRLPHPPTALIRHRADLETQHGFPYYIKTAYGTASRGVWYARNAQERSAVAAILETRALLDGHADIIVQARAAGVLEMALAVFDHGRLLGLHCCQRRVEGAGGSSCAKIGVDRPLVRLHLEQLGQQLGWHGSLALDYLFDPHTGQPSYIDANPRLVEPMQSILSGLNLADLLVRISCGETLPAAQPSVAGRRSHMLMLALLGVAERGDHGWTYCVNLVGHSVALAPMPTARKN